MYDDYFFYVCVILSLTILGVSLHTIYETKTRKMSSTGSYNKGLKQKSIYEDALYFEQGEINRQLESLPNHGWFAKFMHKLFNSFVPDHKERIEKSLKKVSKSKPDVKPGSQRLGFNPHYSNEVQEILNSLSLDDHTENMNKDASGVYNLGRLTYNPPLRDTTTYLNIPNPPKPNKRKI
jgi:hypothetical protein